jgi:hypothetical protein
MPGAVSVAPVVATPDIAGVPVVVTAQFALRPVEQQDSRALLASRDGRAQPALPSPIITTSQRVAATIADWVRRSQGACA